MSETIIKKKRKGKESAVDKKISEFARWLRDRALEQPITFGCDKCKRKIDAPSFQEGKKWFDSHKCK